MKDFVKWLDGSPKWLKLIFCIPVISFVWGFYRLARSINSKKALHIVLAVIMLFINASIFWLVDFITIIVSNKVLWID